MNERDSTDFLLAAPQRSSRPTRRRFLATTAAVGLASMLVSVPARANVRTLECLADLEVF
jgi:hypothetical protein